MKYAYSLNEEDYFGPFDTYGQAYEQGCDNIAENQHSFWIAEVIDTADRLLDYAEHIGEWVIDIVETRMCDFIPSDDDDIIETTRNQLKIIGDAVIDAVMANCKVVRFGVDNPTKVYIFEEDGNEPSPDRT